MYTNSQNEDGGGDYLKKLSELLKRRKKKTPTFYPTAAPEGGPERMGGSGAAGRLRKGDAWDYNPRSY